MSDTRHSPGQADDDPPASPIEVETSEETAEKTVIQIDLYGIKIKGPLRTADTGEQTPENWKDVGQAVHKKLKSIAVNLVGFADDVVIGARRIVRSISELPGALAKWIARSHDVADGGEVKRQEEVAAGLPAPSPTKALDNLEALLLALQADGAAVEIRELEDGRPAIMIVKPEDRQIAAELAAKALPAPQKEKPKGRAKRGTTPRKRQGRKPKTKKPPEPPPVAGA
jgi:hypothetical protein